MVGGAVTRPAATPEVPVAAFPQGTERWPTQEAPPL